MKRQANPMAVLTSWGVALSILAAPRADANPKMILHARAVDPPAVYVVIDTDRGPQIDRQATGAVIDQFAGTDWAILEDGPLIVSKGGKALISSHWWSKKKTWFLLHLLSPKLSVHGTMARTGDDLRSGWAELFVTQPTSDGRSFVTFYVYVNLRFAP